MCRWMGSHFYDWIDYNRGRIFNRVTRMGSHIFGFLGVRLFVIFTVSKRTTIFLLQTESKVVSFNLKNGSIHENRQWKWRLGWRKLHICPKVTKMGSIIGHKIDYNGVGALRGQRAHTQKKLTQVTTRGFFGPKSPFFAWTEALSGMLSFCACTKALRYRVNEDNL